MKDRNSSQESVLSHTDNNANNTGSQDTKSLLKKARIVDISQAPAWLIDNAFLLKGYRVGFDRKRDLFRSLFMRHNELLNIWTHLIGGLISIAVLYYVILHMDNYLLVTKRMIFNEESTNHIQKVFSKQQLMMGESMEVVYDDKEFINTHEIHNKMDLVKECLSDITSNLLGECKEAIMSLKIFIDSHEDSLFNKVLEPFFETVGSV